MQYNSCCKTEKNYREEKRGGKEAGSIKKKKNAQGSRWKRSVKSARRKFIICTVQCLRSLLSTYTAAEVLFYLLQKALHFSPSQSLCSLNLLHFPQQRQRLKKKKKKMPPHLSAINNISGSQQKPSTVSGRRTSPLQLSRAPHTTPLALPPLPSFIERQTRSLAVALRLHVT